MPSSPARTAVTIASTACWTTLGRGATEQAAGLGRSAWRPSGGRIDDRWPYRDLKTRTGHGGQPEALHDVAREALERAELDPECRASCGLILGTSCSTLPEDEHVWRTTGHADREFLAMNQPQGHGTQLERLALELGVHGPRYLVGTACSSSANALLYGARMVSLGRAPAVLVVGAELFNTLTLRGFEALMLLDQQYAKPFDQTRNGLTLGAGVGALVLRPADCTPGPWRLRGGATLSDTDNPTHTSASRVQQVILDAVEQADCTLSEITAVKAHGTATPNNDRAEGQGIAMAFQGSPPAVSSLKGAMGHTLGACGAVETVALMACLDAGFWPRTHGLEHPDPDCGILPCQAPVPMQTGIFLLNFFGFGGNNCVLVLERHHGS